MILYIIYIASIEFKDFITLNIKCRPHHTPHSQPQIADRKLNLNLPWVPKSQSPFKTRTSKRKPTPTRNQIPQVTSLSVLVPCVGSALATRGRLPPPTRHIHPNTLERHEARVKERVVNNEHPPPCPCTEKKREAGCVAISVGLIRRQFLTLRRGEEKADMWGAWDMCQREIENIRP